MPTNLLTSYESFSAEETVLANHEGLRVSRSITLDTSLISADANGNKILPAGSVICAIAGSDYGRPLARASTTAAATTASTTLTVGNAGNFVAGDVLTIPVPSARLDLASVWANADTATVVVDGQSVTHTVAGYTTLTALAVAIKATLDASAIAALVTVLTENQYIYLLSKTGEAYPIAVSEVTAGAGTLTVNGSFTSLQSNQAIGTVESIDPATGIITLTGASSSRLPIGAPIGTAGGTILGISIPPIDLIENSNDVAIYVGATVWGDRLPYWDSSIAAALPMIVLT